MIKWTVLTLLVTATAGVASIVVFRQPFTHGSVCGSFVSFVTYCFVPAERP